MRTPSVLIVGAGLAGLAAARELERRGCRVMVFEARERAGRRVWTVRDGFGGMHGEAGGELIDEEQEEIRQLAKISTCVSRELFAAASRTTGLTMMAGGGNDRLLTSTLPSRLRLAAG